MDNKTISTYNELAEEYDKETVDFWNKFSSNFLGKFIELVSIEGKVLDVGSGSGRDGLILKKSGLNVVCLDASKSMIKLSTNKGLDSVLGDFNNLPFENESFDGVWAYTSLLHVPKSEVGQSFSEIQRVLKPTGIFGLGLIEGEMELYRESSGIGKPRWFSFYKREEVELILKKYGFEIVYFEQLKVNTKNYLHFIAKKI